MRSAARVTAALAATAALVSSVQALQKVSRAGRYLYTDDGNRFYIKGIAYQEQGTVVADPSNPFGEPSSFIDPLSDGSACSRDIPYLQQLGVNTIRAYSVNASLNHDACMQAMSAAGIYTIIDLSLPVNGSIDRDAPSWSTNLLNLYIETIDAFSKYDNVLAFNVGNEVVISPNGTSAAPYIKAAARDVKAYLNSKSSSALVSYAAINGAGNWRDPLASYLACDPSGQNSGATAIDLYGLNDYEWCGASTFEASYAGTHGDFAGLNIPAYFSEFGCVSNPPRLWTEAAALFGPQMTDVFSGGLAFSYFPAESAAGEFGIVTINGNTVTTSADFDALKTQYGQLSPPNTPSKADAGSTSYPACPAQNTTFVASSTLPPTPNTAACNCLESTLSCQFTPATTNTTVIIGSLLDTGCSLLGAKGGSCADIGGDGTAGTYGRVSACDPSIKLSFVMSEYYEANSRDPQACSFAGNGTVNSAAPSSVSAANAAASSCISNAAATFVPTAPGGGSGSSATSTSKSSTTAKSAAPALFGDSKSLLGLALMAVVSISSAVFTLA